MERNSWDLAKTRVCGRCMLALERKHTLLVTVATALLLNACGALDENVSHRFRYLDTWSPVGGATCGGWEV